MHVGHGYVCKQIRTADIFDPYFPFFLLQTEAGKGKMCIQLKLYHCAFNQYNHCYINSYLDEELGLTIVPII